jgi:predicted NBD/HSP70 family sugar kinase
MRGYTGTAGEMGHTKVAGNGRMCSCGSYNCLETIASINAILAQVKEAVSNGALTKLRDIAPDPGNITLSDLRQALAANDKLCRNIVENAGTHIGTALSNVINLINPQLVIFEGPMSELGDAFLDSIKASVYKNSLSFATAGLSFRVSELGDLSAPLGAVTTIADEFFMTEYFNRLYPRQDIVARKPAGTSDTQ